jgi:hypothetical protein
LAKRTPPIEGVFEKVGSLDHGAVTGRCSPIDRRINGTQMPLELRCQFIDMDPLKASLIDFDVIGDVVGDKIDLRAVQNPEGFGADLMERGLSGNARIREEFENLRGFVQLFIALATVLVDLLFTLFLAASRNCRT